jgi:hypothetical protein
VDCAAVWEHVPAGLEQSLEPVLLTKALYPAELAVGNYYAFVEVCYHNSLMVLLQISAVDHCLIARQACVLRLSCYR